MTCVIDPRSVPAYKQLSDMLDYTDTACRNYLPMRAREMMAETTPNYEGVVSILALHMAKMGEIAVAVPQTKPVFFAASKVVDLFKVGDWVKLPGTLDPPALGIISDLPTETEARYAVGFAGRIAHYAGDDLIIVKWPFKVGDKVTYTLSNDGAGIGTNQPHTINLSGEILSERNVDGTWTVSANGGKEAYDVPEANLTLVGE